MNKISLENLNLKEVEQLSRGQLKGVLGGFTGGTGMEGETSSPSSCEEGKKCGGYDPDVYYRSGTCSTSKVTGKCICSSEYGSC